MAFSSTLPAGCLVVDDNNWQHFAQGFNGPDGESDSGLVVRDYHADPLASGYASRRMPKELIIPESEWLKIIKEREESGTRLIDRCEKSGIFTLDQDPSFYCWFYSTTHGVMAAAISQNETPRRLCPESGAGPIMHYKKQGGYCSLALDYIAKEGIADTNAWPWQSHKQANNPKYFEPSRDNAHLTKVTEWWDLDTFEEKMSCLLMGIPVPSCYNYEGHATCSIEPIYRDGQFGVIDIDSYYKRNGNRFHSRARMGKRAWSDDTVAIRNVTPNSLPATS